MRDSKLKRVANIVTTKAHQYESFAPIELDGIENASAGEGWRNIALIFDAVGADDINAERFFVSPETPVRRSTFEIIIYNNINL